MGDPRQVAVGESIPANWRSSRTIHLNTPLNEVTVEPFSTYWLKNVTYGYMAAAATPQCLT